MLVPEGLQLRANTLMTPLLDQVPDPAAWPLPRALRRVGRAGVRRRGALLRLPGFKGAVPEEFDGWQAERWTNEVHLAGALPAEDDRWRLQVLAWGWQLATTLLPRAAQLLVPGERVQACVALQSAPGLADPDIDFSVGSLHLYRVCVPLDDHSVNLEGGVQPALTLTATPAG